MIYQAFINWGMLTICNVTHKLLVKGQDVQWWDKLSQNLQCHSQAVGHRKRCCDAAFHRMCNVTHSLFIIRKMWWDCHSQICNFTNFLLVIGKDVMRLSFTKCAVLLTTCWLYEKSDETDFCKMCNATHLQMVVGKDVITDKTSFPKMCNATLTSWWSWEKMWWDFLS